MINVITIPVILRECTLHAGITLPLVYVDVNIAPYQKPV